MYKYLLFRLLFFSDLDTYIQIIFNYVNDPDQATVSTERGISFNKFIIDYKR